MALSTQSHAQANRQAIVAWSNAERICLSFSLLGEELFLNLAYLASPPGRVAYQVRFPKEPRSGQARPGVFAEMFAGRQE